jgi:pyruvate dehydrogenase E2 component (dihydrolipoamide acetyltransferase)
MAALAARGRLKALAEAVAGPGGQRIDILRPLPALPDALPVRALIGTEDRVIPPHHAFNMPARVAVHFVRAGHMPQWDAPGETLGLLAEARNRH